MTRQDPSFPPAKPTTAIYSASVKLEHYASAACLVFATLLPSFECLSCLFFSASLWVCTAAVLTCVTQCTPSASSSLQAYQTPETFKPSCAQSASSGCNHWSNSCAIGSLRRACVVTQVHTTCGTQLLAAANDELKSSDSFFLSKSQTLQMYCKEWQPPLQNTHSWDSQPGKYAKPANLSGKRHICCPISSDSDGQSS